VTPQPALGLALGGGAAFGAAHLGVLKELARRRLSPGIVTGTSAGALVGGAYAAGLSLDTIEGAVLDADWSTFGTFTLSPRLGLLDTAAFERTIERLGGDLLIETLPIRFGAVATDLLARRQVLITSGPLSQALKASMAVPGLFPPVRREGRILVDGGVAANLPIEAARTMGAVSIIAVRVRPEWEFLPIEGSRQDAAALERAPSTILVRPDLRGYSQWSRADVPHLIEAGRLAAIEALDAAAARGVPVSTDRPISDDGAACTP
jgi:NTE family protein